MKNIKILRLLLKYYKRRLWFAKNNKNKIKNLLNKANKVSKK